MTLELEALAHMLETAPSLNCPPTVIDRVLKRIADAPQHTDMPGVRYRASSIGKPWITQVLDAWYGGARSYTVSSCMNMLNGIVAESWAVEILSLCDYKMLTQGTVHIGCVAGHYDIVVDKGSKLLVLEVKSMGAHILPGFAANPNDDYGYLSQLSFYWGAMRDAHPSKQVEAAFVLFDRSTSKFRVVPIMTFAMERKLERLANAMSSLSNLADYDVDGLLDLGAVPPCVGGKLPSSMTYSRWSKVLYRNTGDRWVEQDLDAVARQLKQLPLERHDRTN